jgi:hypothetical protein
MVKFRSFLRFTRKINLVPAVGEAGCAAKLEKMYGEEKKNFFPLTLIIIQTIPHEQSIGRRKDEF